jgi:hypothetical protein
VLPEAEGSMLAYLTILSTATASFFGAPVWSLLLGAGVLMLLSAIDHRELTASYSKPYARSAVGWAAWQSAGHATLAASAAYMLGYLTQLSF